MKYILPLLVIIIYFFLNTNYSHSNQSSPDKTVLDGLDDIYNLKFDDAENKFKQFKTNNPNDLRGYFYESLIYFYKSLPARDDVFFEKYLDLSEKVIERAELKLDNNENDYDALYYKGLSHSYRSLIMLSLNKSLLKAASNGNDGYKILSSLIEKNPDYYDAYMGLGLYKIAIGFVPGKFQWLLSLIGFNGDIREGISLLETSLAKGKYTKIDSKVFLSLFSLKEKEDNDKKALNYSRELTEAYPQSPIFKIFYSSLLLQYGFVDESILTSQEALALNKNSFQNEIKKAAGATLGIAYFRLNNFDQATVYLEEFRKYLFPKDRINVYLFTLGVSYELIGNRTKAVEIYKIIKNDFVNERDGELDKFFYRYAQNKIKNPIKDFESKLIFGMNLRESNKLNEAINFYNEMIDSKILERNYSADNEIRLYFDVGVAYAYKGELDKAIESFNKCVRLEPESEKWLVPHSYFELGKIYSRLGNNKKSGEMFEMIYNYEDFDFESFLEMRLANFRNK